MPEKQGQILLNHLNEKEFFVYNSTFVGKRYEKMENTRAGNGLRF